jgi:predicted RNA binding protein YcfA (HicA-like mRNA interferase family)
MADKLAPIRWQEFEKFLFFIGCDFVRQTGGHRVYRRSGTVRPIIVPAHPKPLPVMVIKTNLRTLGIEPAQYLDILKDL